ncbi:MAG: hypothetical protein BGO31_12610 [Bacteroidetes bacterium 43-16]|nr:MAG: hypothetical protein BGO31_12610 [Bacteroidetes bacterium 43-16]
MLNKKPSINSILVIDEINQSELIGQAIMENRPFTEVPMIRPEKVVSRGLVLLCLSSDISPEGSGFYICILKKQSRVATGKVRIKCTDAIALDGLDLETFIDRFSIRYGNSLNQAFQNNYTKVSDKLSYLLFDNLCLEFPDHIEEFHRLFDKSKGFLPKEHKFRDEDAAAEKDALSICIDIFGIDRSPILRSWDAKEGRLGHSFLSGLNDYICYEDDILNKDLRNIPGYEVVSEFVTGVVEFENKHGDKLCVINANRKPIEKATGVDLIYFHRKYDAFTCVQYKMMDRSDTDRNYYYNPKNTSHDRELARMTDLLALLNKEQKGSCLIDFRVSSCPFFFKLCKKMSIKEDDGAIVTGAYIPLDQWLFLINDDSTKGKNGGTQLGYHTLGQRYLTKQTFIELVQRGMLGTQAMGSKKMAAFIESAIKMGHSVMYAIDNSKTRIFDEDDD